MKHAVKFYGKYRGAIGQSERFYVEVTADSWAEVVQALYRTHDHIGAMWIKPFDSDVWTKINHEGDAVDVSKNMNGPLTYRQRTAIDRYATGGRSQRGIHGGRL